MNTENIEQIYELSPLQQGMLFHSVLEPTSGMYIEQFGLTLQGELNMDAMMRAAQQVVDRHPALRASYYWKEVDKPLQVVHREVTLPFTVDDWRHLSAEQQAADLAAFYADDQAKGFDLSNAPLMRFHLIRMGEEQHQLIWTFHHVLIDGWSFQIVLREFMDLYKAESTGGVLALSTKRPYQDYIAWMQAQDLSQAEAYWRNVLQGFSVPTTMQVEKQSNAGQTNDNALQKYKLSAKTTDALQSLARQHQVTLNTMMQAVWALLLSRYSAEEDVLFGATVAGRSADLPGIEEMVGLFINTLPVRVLVPTEMAFIDWVKQLQAQQFEALQYEYASLLNLQEWSDVPRGMALFKTLFVYQNYPMGEEQSTLGEHLEITDSVFLERSNYPLALEVNPGSELSVLFSYDQNTYDGEIIERMASHLFTMLEGIVANPEQLVQQVPMLTAQERELLLVEWNNTGADHPTDQCMHHLFEQTAALTPDAVAVAYRDENLTYEELNQRANRLAHYLQKQGVGPETLVGLAVTPSFEMVVAILGILKAGGAYVPLDPNYPQDRLAFMLEDSQVGLIVTLEHLQQALPEFPAKVVCLDTDAEIMQESTENPVSDVTADNLAYIIYTSGSTGKPKGVLITHRPVVNLMFAVSRTFELQPSDRVLQFASISFDITIEEMFPTWKSGGTVVLRPEPVLASTKDYSRWILEGGITVVNMPTAYWHEWVNDLSRHPEWVPQALRLVIVGGEKAAPATLAVWRELTQGRIQLRNGYGPTETTVTTTVYDPRMHADKPELLARMPIGRPIDNYQIYIVDKQMQLTPVGVAGEILVGGIGLARGYLKRPELTDEKFIPNPFSDEPGARLYRTGDLARYLPDGSIEFLGRVDHQVKIRGFRIELGEIEEVLTEQPAVDEAVVIVREDMPGDKCLVAYLVGDREQLTELAELRAALRVKLPEFMVPAYFVVLDAMPLTLNNKVDRKKLPMPDMTRQLDEEFVAPRTETEAMLAQIWADVLHVDKVGIHDDFFALGGHSLLATQIISRLYHAVQIELPLRALFEAPTVAEFAKRMERQEEPVQEPALKAVSRDNRRRGRVLEPARKD